MINASNLGNKRIDQETFEQILDHIKLKITGNYPSSKRSKKSKQQSIDKVDNPTENQL